MATYTNPKTMVAGTDILAADVNQDFDAIKSFFNNDVLHVDASRATTSILSGPNASPTTDNQYARKKYVDDCRSHVICRNSHTSNSLFIIDSVTDSGIATPTFTIPTISLAHPLQVSLYVPEFLVSSYSGSPIAGKSLELFFYSAGHTLLQRGGSNVAGTLLPSDAESVFMRRTFFDNAVLTVGGTTSIELWGRLTGGGKFQTVGTASTPVELIVEQL